MAGTPHVLITRPQEDSETLAAILEAQGIASTIEPLLDIEPLHPPPAFDLTGVVALLFTSRNGARLFAGLSAARDIPCFAVGPGTATTLGELGFMTVQSAEGDSATLLAKILTDIPSGSGALLHIGGEDQADDLAGKLIEHGYDCRRLIVYRARAKTRFSAEIQAGLQAKRYSGVLLFSPRTAATFARLIKLSGQLEKLRALTAYCLSPAVAQAVGELPWAKIAVAPNPSQPALLRLVMKDRSEMPTKSEHPIRSQRRFSLVAILAVLLLVAGGTFALSHLDRGMLATFFGTSAEPPPPALLSSALPSSNPSPRDAAASDALERMPAQIEALARDLAELRAKLGELSEQNIQAKTAGAGLVEQIDELQRQVARLKDQARQENNNPRTFALLSAIGQIHISLSHGRAFPRELEAVKKLGADLLTPAQISALAAAVAGVASDRDLTRQFLELAHEQPYRDTVNDVPSVWESVMRWLRSLVRIRRTDEPSPADDQARAFAAVVQDLDRGDIVAAIAKVKAISTETPDSFTLWIAAAEARLAAEQALASIETAALATLDPARAAP